jgi:hypothetical protein
MICPNCGKLYHWCNSCSWDAGMYACSYECAQQLYENKRMSGEAMGLWELEKQYEIMYKNSFSKYRAAKTVKSAAQDSKLTEYREKRKNAMENQHPVSQKEGEEQLRKYSPRNNKVLTIAKILYRFNGGSDKENIEEWNAVSNDPPQKWEDLEQWERDKYIFVAEKVVDVALTSSLEIKPSPLEPEEMGDPDE